MELQMPYITKHRTKENIFRQLFLISMELERFGNDQPLHSDNVRKIVESIDQLFESVIEDESRGEP